MKQAHDVRQRTHSGAETPWLGRKGEGKYPQGARGGVVPLRCQQLGVRRGKATQKVPVDVEKAIPKRIRTPLGLPGRVSSGFSREAYSTVKLCMSASSRASERASLAWLGLAWVLAARTTSRTFRQGAQCYFAERYIHSDDLRVYICNTTVNHSLLLAWSSRTFLTSPRRSVTSSLCQFGLWPLASSASSRGGSTVGSNRYRAKSD